MGQAVILDSEFLIPFRKIILFAWWGYDNEFTDMLIYTSFINSIRRALDTNLTSLAFPVFGAGSRYVRLDNFCFQFLQVLRDLNHLRDSASFSLIEIKFVSDNSYDIDFIREYINNRLK